MGTTRPSFTARNFLTRPPTGKYFPPALPSDCFAIDLPGRASSPGEGLPRPRVARAQEINRLHPLLCWRRRERAFCCWNGMATWEGLETVCETRRTKASFTRGPGSVNDGRFSESVRVMPFYYGKRSASICVVLGPKKSSPYSSEYASRFFEPAASRLPAASLPRNEGLRG